MQDLIKAFTTYAGPDTDAQRNQYQRMLDLTRSAANACTGLYGKEDKKKELFVDLHLAELKALAYANDRISIKAKYSNFQAALQKCRNNPCCNEQCKQEVLETETELLKAIHMLETESWLGKLRNIDLLLIGITIALLLGFWLHIAKLIIWLPKPIESVLPDVLQDHGWIVPVVAWVFALLLIRTFWIRRGKATDDKLDSSVQKQNPSDDGDSSA